MFILEQPEPSLVEQSEWKMTKSEVTEGKEEERFQAKPGGRASLVGMWPGWSHRMLHLEKPCTSLNALLLPS